MIHLVLTVISNQLANVIHLLLTVNIEPICKPDLIHLVTDGYTEPISQRNSPSADGYIESN